MPGTANEPELVSRLPSAFNGYDLSVRRVRGELFVRKRFSAGAERRYRTERAAYEHLAACGCGCAPELLTRPPVPPEGNELWIRVFPGAPLGQDGTGVAAVAEAVGSYHRAMATSLGSSYGSLSHAERRVAPEDYWLSHTGDLERACADRGLPAAWMPSFRARVRAGLKADDGDECTLVHRDLRPDNILVDEDGRVRIIDWEIAAVLHPAFDLARLLLADAFDGAAVRAEFFRHYEREFSDQVTRMCRATLGIQLISYAPPTGTSHELVRQGVALLESAL